MGDEQKGVIASIGLRASIIHLAEMCNDGEFLRVVAEGERILVDYPHTQEVVNILAQACSGLWKAYGYAKDARRAAKYWHQLAELDPDVRIKRMALARAKRLIASADNAIARE